MVGYALIGYPLSHSFSKAYFDEKFANEAICDTYFKNIELPSLDALPGIVAGNPDLKGIAVTIPHKTNVLAYLHSWHPDVKTIGACNCIKLKGNSLIGYNTDIIGFESAFLHLRDRRKHKKAMVLGAGGAARAVVYVLEKLKIPYVQVNRDKSKGIALLSYEEITAALVDEYKVIINTTPLGTSPMVDEYPPIPYEHITADHYLFDLVYNPIKTAFLAKGEQCGATIQNGSAMLAIQAEENWKIWNS